MSDNLFEEYKTQVDGFNEKFSLHFSFEAYDTNQLRMNNLMSFFAHDEKVSPENNIYRGAFLNLYRESVENAIHKKSDLVDPAELFRSFNELMRNYREYCGRKGQKVPDANGGWKSSDGIAVVESMRKKISDIKPDKSDFIKDQYLQGKFPLRRMRAELEQMSISNPPSVEDLSKAIVYFKALEKTRNERTGAWKASPFNWVRNRAEKRDLLALNDYINRMAETHIDIYDKAIDMAKENVIERAHQSLDKTIETIQARQQQREKENTQQKEQLKIDKNLNLKKDEMQNEKEIEKPVSDTKKDSKEVKPNEKETFEEAIDSVSYEMKCHKALDDIHLSESIQTQIFNIVKNSDIKESRVADFAKDALSNLQTIVTNICEYVDGGISDQDRSKIMKSGAENIFHEIYLQLKNNFVFENTVDRVIAAQTMADLMLKAYSPAAFEPSTFYKYADNHVLNNEEILKEEMVETYDDCAESDESFAEFVKELNAARFNKKEIKKETEKVTEEEIEKKPEEKKPEEKKPTPVKAPVKITPTPNSNHVKNNPQPIFIKFGCRERAQDIMQSKRHLHHIEDQIREALKDKTNKSILHSDVITNIMQSMFEVSDKFNKNHDDLGAAQASPRKIEGHIQDEIQLLFQTAYRSLNPCGMQHKDRVVAAQKISDVIINEVTPIAFNGETLEKYGQNYAINDPTMVSDILQYSEGFNKSMCNAIAEEARAEILNPTKEHIRIKEFDNPSDSTAISEKYVSERTVDKSALKK